MDERTQRAMETASKSGYASAETEQALIGSIVLEFDKCAHLVQELSEDDFYYEPYKLTLRAVKRTLSDGLAVDLITVNQSLLKIDPLNAGSVTEKISEALRVAQPWAADSHCRIIKELAARRKAIAMVGEIQLALQDPSTSINAIVDRLSGSTDKLLVSGHEWASMEDVLLNAYNYIEKRSRGEIRSITTGIPNLDKAIGGFFGGELTVIGARPAVGKSVFGMNVALEAARQGYKIGIVSREMTDVQYGQRILSYASGVDGMKIRQATLSEDDWGELAEGLAYAATLPISFLFSVRTVEDLRAEVRRRHNRGEIDLLVVDYLQLVETEERYKEDRLRVAHISRALKNIATDFNIPVIALAQVKRFAGGARAKMPTLEDLKDSGSIEQDADNVIFLHNPYDEDDEFVDPRDKDAFNAYQTAGFTYLCLGIAKQRQGATGKCCVLFDKAKMRYVTIDRSGREEQ